MQQIEDIEVFINWVGNNFKKSKLNKTDILEMTEETLKLLKEVKEENNKLKEENILLTKFRFHTVSTLSDKQLKTIINKIHGKNR